MYRNVYFLSRWGTRDSRAGLTTGLVCQTSFVSLRPRNGPLYTNDDRTHSFFSFSLSFTLPLCLSVSRCSDVRVTTEKRVSLARQKEGRDPLRRSRSGTASRCGIDDGWLALVTTHGTHRSSPSLPLPRRTRATALLPGERLPYFSLGVSPGVGRIFALIVCVCVCVHAHDLSLPILLARRASLSLSKTGSRPISPSRTFKLSSALALFSSRFAFLSLGLDPAYFIFFFFFFFFFLRSPRGCFSFLSTRARRLENDALIRLARTPHQQPLYKPSAASACLSPFRHAPPLLASASNHEFLASSPSFVLLAIYSLIVDSGMPSCRKQLLDDTFISIVWE